MTQEKLKEYIERIERLTEEKQAIMEDIKDIFLEAKSNGFEVKAMKHVLKERKKNEQERIHDNQMNDTYMNALGMSV